MTIIVHRISFVCFDGSGTVIVILLHVCRTLRAVASVGVGACCDILMVLSHKVAGFGGPDGERFVWECANQKSGFWGANP